MWQFWLILAGIFLVIEIITIGFLFFWFAMGALIALAVSLFTSNIVVQAVVFLVTSTVLLFVTRPLVDKILPKETSVTTNSSHIEGKVGVVTKDIDPVKGSGQIKINSEIWSAKTEDGSFLEKDNEIEVVKVEGVKAIVKKIN